MGEELSTSGIITQLYLIYFAIIVTFSSAATYYKINQIYAAYSNILYIILYTKGHVNLSEADERVQQSQFAQSLDI